jgi:hypothetical protein
MEFVAAQERALWPERALRSEAGLAIAERHPAVFEAGLDAEQARHLVGGAGGVDKALAQSHIAPTFAVHRARLSEAPETFTKSRCRRQLPGVQFRITARKPTYVAIERGRLVGER